MKVRVLTGMVAILVACGPTAQEDRPQRPSDRAPGISEEELAEARSDFEALRDRFLAGYYEARPVRATSLGIHDHDDQLPALDRFGVQQRIDQLLEWVADLEDIPFGHLEGEDRYDYAILEYALRSQLLELEETRSWVRDPRVYTNTIARGISSIAERPYAPLSERAASIVARMEASEELLSTARANLSGPPALWTDLAITDTRGLIEFLEEDLPAMLSAQAGGGSAMDRHGLAGARDRLVAALEQHVEWLETELMPRSTGDFRLGRYLFERKLLYEEHVALGVPELERLNEAAIVRYQEWVARVAAEIDPDRSPRAIMDSLVQEHPEPDELLGTARSMMLSARDWVVETGVVPIPVDAVPVVRETPPYARSGFASMDAPGPFETAALEAFYNITNVQPEWTETQKQQHLTYFNYPGLLGVTIHETFPGHFVQLAYEQQVESDLRKVFTPSSFVEGWAHYTEQMVLDEGFGDGDPALRLGQLRRALQRHARWYAALHLHAFGTPLEEIVERFQEIAYFEEFPARREVVRGTYDPTYLYYALGRMQILDLREDYRERRESEGESFVLSEFHDELLRLALPIPLAREVMLPLASEDGR